MAKNMFRVILISLLPIIAYAEGIAVKTSLAEMIEEVVVQSGLDGINIPSENMTELSVNINQINGVNVCDTSVQQKVINLVELFGKHKNLNSVISHQGAYVKKDDGSVGYVPASSPLIKNLVPECSSIYVSVK